MASIHRVVCEWSGGAGLPGYSVLYGVGTSTAVITELVSFFTSIADRIPFGVSVRVPSAGDSIEDSTGVLSGSWSGGAGSTVAGAGGATWAAGVGALCVWNTGGIRNGRRVKGRTFLAPLDDGGFDGSGSFTSTYINDLQAAATVLASSGELVVWSRPSAPGAGDGESNVVLSATIPDRVTSLRTRRY